MATRHGQVSDTGRANGLNVRDWRPTARSRGAFLLLHGMESHSGWFGEVAIRLVEHGWTVIAYDRSGWGQSRGVRGHLASYRDFVEEIAGIASTCRAKCGSVHLGGMSWGGMAALYMGLRRSWLFDSLTLLAPGLESRLDLPFFSKLRVAVDFFREKLTDTVEPVFKPEHFSNDPDWQKLIEEDTDRVRRVTAGFCIETYKMRRFCAETAGRRQIPPALCLLAGDDRVIDNAPVEALCRKAGARVETLHGAAHTLVFDRAKEVAERMVAHASAAVAEREGRRGRVWILGGGAVGGGVGTLLSFGGVSTGMLIKPQYVNGLRECGFTLRSGHAVRTAKASQICFGGIRDLPPDPDLVILAVKSYDTGAVLAGLAGKIPPRAILGTLQNGIGNEARIAAAFPEHTIFAGSICASLEMLESGVVQWPDDRGGIGAAPFQGDSEAARETWLRIMPFSGMETRWYDGHKAADRLKWSKLMLNIGFNALNSLTGSSTAELLRNHEYGCLAVRALREGFAVMRAMDLEPVDLPGASVSMLNLAVRAPVNVARKMIAFEAARSTEASFSMRQDMLHQRQHTEIQDLNGVIVQSGYRLGVRTPANESLVKLIEKSQNDL